MSQVESFDYQSYPVRVVFGPGRLDSVPDELDRLGCERVMLIADAAAPGGKQLVGRLGDRLADVWNELAQHVPIPIAERARRAAADGAVDGLVSLGGGTATGLAKAIALDSGLPILAVPTTYAGSELTPVYGMTGNQRKRTGSDERVRPKVVIYDPELTTGLPAEVTGPSAFNAMAHCFGALWAPGGNPLTRALAAEGIRAVVASLPVLREDPAELGARAGLQYAAFLGGTVLGTVGTALQHRICHSLGGRLGLAHADTHAAVLPHVVALNMPVLAGCLEPVLGARPATALWDLARRVGLTTSLARLGAGAEHLRAVARDVAGSANPVPADADVIEALLRRAFDDEPPEES
jgi:maleylacetate reductase